MNRGHPHVPKRAPLLHMLPTESNCIYSSIKQYFKKSREISVVLETFVCSSHLAPCGIQCFWLTFGSKAMSFPHVAGQEGTSECNPLEKLVRWFFCDNLGKYLKCYSWYPSLRQRLSCPSGSASERVCWCWGSWRALAASWVCHLRKAS